jgi:hypothetical protein
MSTKPAIISEKAAKSRQITPRQKEFAELYFMHHFVVDAADAMNISERTGRRWFALPQVRAEIERLQQERRDAIRKKFEAALDFASELMVNTLRKAVYPDLGSVDPDRVNTFVALLLKYAHDQGEIDALKQRIAELERAGVGSRGQHDVIVREAALQALTDEELEMFARIAKRLEAIDGTIEEEQEHP